MEYLYLIVILLIARQSIHIMLLTSFLGTSRAGIEHGLMISLIRSLASNSSTCPLNFYSILSIDLVWSFVWQSNTENQVNATLNISNVGNLKEISPGNTKDNYEVKSEQVDE